MSDTSLWSTLLQQVRAASATCCVDSVRWIAGAAATAELENLDEQLLAVECPQTWQYTVWLLKVLVGTCQRWCIA
jgi:hypothetical protein